MKVLKNFYDWILHWSKTPYGTAILFRLAFIESSFFSVPSDAVLIAMDLGSRQ